MAFALCRCLTSYHSSVSYAELGKVDKAIQLLEQALEIGHAIKDPRVVGAVSNRLKELRGS